MNYLQTQATRHSEPKFYLKPMAKPSPDRGCEYALHKRIRANEITSHSELSLLCHPQSSSIAQRPVI